MPEVFTNQQPRATKACVKGTDTVTPGEETPFVKQTVSGHIHFVMHMEHTSAGEIGRGDKKTMTRILIYKTDHEVNILTRFEKMLENRVVLRGTMCDCGNEILHHISC